MTQPTHAELPQPGDLVVRRIPFEFTDDIDPHWKHGEPEWSHMVNGASLTMPYLEPFLIDSVRDALESIDDPAVREAAKGFNAQEGQHFRQHRRYNEILKAKGYPELARVEESMQASYDRMRERRSLQFRMAYTAGFESMTLGVTAWLVEQRRRLFGGADPRVASFVLWHFVEEAEHKRVAFDVYQAACPGYWMRALGVIVGSLHLMWLTRRGYVAMLKRDGLWWNPRSRLRLWRRVLEFMSYALPYIVRSLSPRHDPSHEPDLEWVRAWIRGYAMQSDADRVPLVDTASADLPPPFSEATA